MDTHIYPTSMYTHLTSQKMASYFTQHHIKAEDTVDAAPLRPTSRDDDAALLTSMYVIS